MRHGDRTAKARGTHFVVSVKQASSGDVRHPRRRRSRAQLALYEVVQNRFKGQLWAVFDLFLRLVLNLSRLVAEERSLVDQRFPEYVGRAVDQPSGWCGALRRPRGWNGRGDGWHLHDGRGRESSKPNRPHPHVMAGVFCICISLGSCLLRHRFLTRSERVLMWLGRFGDRRK